MVALYFVLALLTLSSSVMETFGSEANLKLIGGSKSSEGNIFYKGKPVCDDTFHGYGSKAGYGKRNGEVVCRELGFPGFERFTRESHFGLVPADFSMDEVKCAGNESRLDDCPHTTNEDCGAKEGAGVVCKGHSSDCMTTPSRPGWFGSSKANTKCIFPFKYDGKTYYSCAPGSAATNMEDDALWCSTDVYSDGKHKYLEHHSGRQTWGYCNENCKVLENLRLIGGSKPNKGNIYYKGKPVCDDTFFVDYDYDFDGGIKNGDVVCRELGFSGLSRFYIHSSFGNVPEDFSMENLLCSGNESRLEDCPHRLNGLGFQTCGVTNGAGVICIDEENCQRNETYGQDYAGTVNKTKSGFTCQEWTQQSPHGHEFKIFGDHNYCRNPDGISGVWCYTTNPNRRWELCDVDVCGRPKIPGTVDCQRRMTNGEDYAGTVNKTKSGFTCQEWTQQTPHRHQLESYGDYNYCRNPDRGSGVWCFTTNPDKRWELCDVPICEDKEIGTCLTSPGYPDPYPNSQVSKQSLEVPAGQHIRVTFLYFDIEETRKSCPHDYLELLDGTGTRVGEKLCGYYLPQNITIQTSTAEAIFKSDWVNTGGGFKLCYTPVNDEGSGSGSGDEGSGSGSGDEGSGSGFGDEGYGYESCTEVDIDYDGSDIKDIVDIPNWQSCAKLCSQQVGCSYWTWVSPNYQTESIHHKCHLKNSRMGRTHLSGVISGSSACQGNYCVDKHDACPSWKENGVCTSLTGMGTMSYDCPESCGKCGDNGGMKIEAKDAMCTKYTVLTDAWRHINYTNRIRGYSSSHCDKTGPQSYWDSFTNLTYGFYRFGGAAGTALPTGPAPVGGPPRLGKQFCGTSSSPYIISGGHPTSKDGIVSRDISFEGFNGGNDMLFTIKVAACRDIQGDFFVYELYPVGGCDLGYCAID